MNRRAWRRRCVECGKRIWPWQRSDWYYDSTGRPYRWHHGCDHQPYIPRLDQ